MNQNILIAAAHPEDQIPVCEVTIALYKNKGFNIHAAFIKEHQRFVKKLLQT